MKHIKLNPSTVLMMYLGAHLADSDPAIHDLFELFKVKAREIQDQAGVQVAFDAGSSIEVRDAVVNFYNNILADIHIQLSLGNPNATQH